MPQVKISTQAAVLRPTPGSASRNSSDSSRGAVSVQSRSGWLAEPLEDRLDPRRLLLGQAAGPDRLLELVDRRVAHLLPGREALAQARRRTRSRLRSLVCWESTVLTSSAIGCPCGSLTGCPYISRSRSRIARTRRLSGRFQLTAGTLCSAAICSVRWRARSKSGACRSTGCGSSTGGCRGRGRRPSTATATRPTARTGSRSWSGAGPRSRSTCRAGGARTGPTRPASTTRCTGSRPSSSAASTSSGSGSASSSSTTGAALALIGAQRRPELVEKLVDRQRGAAAARLPLALGRAALAPPAARRDRQRDDDHASSLALLHAPGARRPQPDAARVRRHDLGPLGHAAPGAPILALYRHADPDRLAAAGKDLGRLTCPALVLWGDRDLYLPTKFAQAYADALPNAELELDRRRRPLALDRRPRVIDRVVDFLG